MAKNSSISTSTTTTAVLDDVVFLDESQMESNDISYWELVNQSDVDDSDDESLLSVEDNGFVSWYSIGEISPKRQFGNAQIGFEEEGCNFVVGCDEIDVNSIGFEPDCGEIHVKFESFDDQGCGVDVIDVNSIGFESDCGKSGGVNVNFESFGDQGCFDDELDVSSIEIESNYGKNHGMHVKVDSFDDGDDNDDDDDDYDGYGLDDELVPWNVSGRLERQRMRKLGKRVFAKMSHSRRNPHRFVKPGCVRGKHGLGIKAA